jgi:hypothetical protein
MTAARQLPDIKLNTKLAPEAIPFWLQILAAKPLPIIPIQA